MEREKAFKLLLFLVLVSWQPSVSAELTGTDKTVATTAVTTGSQIALGVSTAISTIKDTDVSKYVTEVGKVMGAVAPFLGALGSVLSIILAFLPQRPDPVMVEMKEKFAEVMTKLDVLDTKLNDIGDMIEWSHYKDKVDGPESEVNSMHKYLTETIPSCNNVTVCIKHFLLTRASDYDKPTDYYTAITGDTSLSDKFFDAASKYFKYDRESMRELGAAVLGMMEKAAAVDMAVHVMHAENDPSLALPANLDTDNNCENWDICKIWKTRYQEVVDEIERIDQDINDNFKVYMKEDVEDYAVANPSMGNVNFVNTMRPILEAKWFWKKVIVISNAYNIPNGIAYRYMSVALAAK